MQALYPASFPGRSQPETTELSKSPYLNANLSWKRKRAPHSVTPYFELVEASLRDPSAAPGRLVFPALCATHAGAKACIDKGGKTLSVTEPRAKNSGPIPFKIGVVESSVWGLEKRKIEHSAIVESPSHLSKLKCRAVGVVGTQPIFWGQITTSPEMDAKQCINCFFEC